MNNNIITFSARGTKFYIPRLLLKKYPDTLLHNLCVNENIPIDTLDNDILIDINPSNISIITDLYNYGDIETLNVHSILLYMDLKYLGFDIRYDKILPHMTEPLVYDNLKNEVHNSINFDYYNIYTTDNNIIKLDCNIIDNWMNCKFKSIVNGEYEEYIINKNDNCLDVWIGLNTYKVHYILSIMRDGLNWYYYDYPILYDKSMGELKCDIKCANTNDNEKIGFYKLYEYHYSNDKNKNQNLNLLKDEYHKLRNVCSNRENYDYTGELKEKYLDLQNNIYTTFDNMINAIDINSKLNKKEIKNIIDNINKLNDNQNGIVQFVHKLTKSINYNQYILNINHKNMNEYVIDHKILYFYGILDDGVKKQLEGRKK